MGIGQVRDHAGIRSQIKGLQATFNTHDDIAMAHLDTFRIASCSRSVTQHIGVIGAWRHIFKRDSFSRLFRNDILKIVDIDAIATTISYFMVVGNNVLQRLDLAGLLHVC
jgi:hypothetical protein